MLIIVPRRPWWVVLPAGCSAEAPSPPPPAILYACFHSPACYAALGEALDREAAGAEVTIAYVPEDAAETNFALRLLQVRTRDPAAERSVLRRLVDWHAVTGATGIGPGFAYAAPEATGVPLDPPPETFLPALSAQRAQFEGIGGQLGPLWRSE